MTDVAVPATPNEPAAAPIPLVLPPAHFTNLASVLRAVHLEFPVTFAGRDWPAICIRRLSVAQIAAMFDNYRANLAINPEAQMALPIFVDEACQSIPDGLLAELDPDDRDALEAAANVFLPRKLRASSDTAPASGATTSPSAPE